MLLSNLALGHTGFADVLGWTHGASLSSLGAAFQEPVAVSHINSRLLMWFVGIATLAIVVQALILLGMAIGGMKIAKDLMKIVEEARAKAMPLIDTTQTLVKDLTPQIKQITNKVELIAGKVDVIAGRVEVMSGVAVEKVNEFSPTISAARETVDQANQTVRDANRKTHEQVMRVNEMITSVLDSMVRASAVLQRGMGWPGREASGLVNGFKAGFETLLGKAKNFGESRPLSSRRTPDQSTGSPYRTAAAANRYTSMAEEKLARPAIPETREFGR
jgi:hypothetical protein